MIVAHDDLWSLHGLPVIYYLIVGAVSLGICLILLRSAQRRAGLVWQIDDITVLPALRRKTAPRMGGLAIFIAMEIAAGLMAKDGTALMAQILLAALPVVVAGLLQDSGRDLHPRLHLVTAALSALIAMHMTGAMIHRVAVPLVDDLLRLLPVAVLFTTYVVASICNSVSSGDRVNGLSGTLTTISAAGMAAVAAAHGQADIAVIATVLAAAIMGFLLLNYPHGRIRLGRGGAQLIGFVLAWLAVMLMQRAPMVSVWAMALILFWPLADTLLDVYRRRSMGRPSDLPDRQHYHQLVRRALAALMPGRRGWALTNPLVTLIIAPLAALPTVAGVILATRSGPAAMAVLAAGAAFFASYLLLATVTRRPKHAAAPQAAHAPLHHSVAGPST